MKSVLHNSLRWGIALLMMLCTCLQASAQLRREQADSCFQVYYPLSRTHIQEDYLDNAERIAALRHFLQQAPRIDSLVIYAYSSPEGSYAFNERLSRQRGERAKQYLRSLLPEGYSLPDSLIILSPQSENWDGLRREVVNSYPHDDKEALLAILDSDLSPTEKEVRLKQVSNGEAWRYLLKHYMPRLRYATWISVWSQLPPVDAIHQLPSLLVVMPSVPALPAIQKPMVKTDTTDTRTWLALKTNLLYDAVSWLNFSIEVPIGERFSALYYHQFPWWRWGENKNEFSMCFLSIGAEGRWWFKPMPYEATETRLKRDRLTGWFAGVYLESGKWDFNLKRRICYQGEHWSTGVSVGYAMPIGKRLNLEFSLSAGYASITHRGYGLSDDYSKLYHLPEKDGIWHYWGPTKAQISLVLPLITSIKKGGKL